MERENLMYRKKIRRVAHFIVQLFIFKTESKNGDKMLSIKSNIVASVTFRRKNQFGQQI